MLFGWETVLSFILVSTVYATAIGSPNFGNVAPLAVGVSLALDIMAGSAPGSAQTFAHELQGRFRLSLHA